MISDSLGSVMLNDSKIWSAIEALAAFLEGNYEGDGAYGALGDDKESKYADMHGEDGGGLQVLKACGLTSTYWAGEGLAAWHARYEASIAKAKQPARRWAEASQAARQRPSRPRPGAESRQRPFMARLEA